MGRKSNTITTQKHMRGIPEVTLYQEAKARTLPLLLEPISIGQPEVTRRNMSHKEHNRPWHSSIFTFMISPLFKRSRTYSDSSLF